MQDFVTSINSSYAFSIDEIINLLKKHCYYDSKNSYFLPIIAMHSIYECFIEEVTRFKDKRLSSLNSCLNKCYSNNAFSLALFNKDDSMYEAIDIKFNIAPTYTMLKESLDVITRSSIERYYILSNVFASDKELVKINKLIEDIMQEQGGEVILDDFFDTLKYYLMCLKNTDVFLKRCLNKIIDNKECNFFI